MRITARFMAEALFRKIPCTFLGRLIKRREASLFENAWCAEFDGRFEEKAKAAMMADLKALMAMKVMRRRLDHEQGGQGLLQGAEKV